MYDEWVLYNDYKAPSQVDQMDPILEGLTRASHMDPPSSFYLLLYGFHVDMLIISTKHMGRCPLAA